MPMKIPTVLAVSRIKRTKTSAAPTAGDFDRFLGNVRAIRAEAQNIKTCLAEIRKVAGIAATGPGVATIGAATTPATTTAAAWGTTTATATSAG